MKSLMTRTLLLIAAAGYFFAALHSVQHLHLDTGGAVACHTHHGDPSQNGDAAADDCPICIAHALTALFIVPFSLTADSEVEKIATLPAPQNRAVASDTTQSFDARAPPLS